MSLARVAPGWEPEWYQRARERSYDPTNSAFADEIADIKSDMLTRRIEITTDNCIDTPRSKENAPAARRTGAR